MSPDPPQEEPPSLPVICAAKVTIEPVDWIWKGYIATRTIAILDGDPGLGKSTLTAHIAARVSRGESLPGDVRTHPPSSVLMISLEDSTSAVIVPRLMAAGADLEKIQIWKLDQEEFSLPTSFARLAETVRYFGIRLVMIDPLVATLDLGIDAHRDQHVRGVFAGVMAIAESTGAGFLFVRHLNKNLAASALHRGGGSIGIIGAARCGLLMAKDPNDPDSRILAVNKNNLGAHAPSLRFHLESAPPPAEGIEVATICWDGEATETADDLVAAPPDAGEQGKIEEASEFLREALRAGPMPAEEVKSLAKAAKIAERTLYRAKAKLKVKSLHPEERGAPWCWRLPEPKEGKKR